MTLIGHTEYKPQIFSFPLRNTSEKPRNYARPSRILALRKTIYLPKKKFPDAYIALTYYKNYLTMFFVARLFRAPRNSENGERSVRTTLTTFTHFSLLLQQLQHGLPNFSDIY